MENPKTNRVLRLDDVKNTTGLGRSSIYAFMKQGTFPKSISLGQRAVGWLEKDVQAWIEKRISN